MKRLSLIAIVLLLSATMVELSAQQVVKKRIGVYKENGRHVVAEANTTLEVCLTIEREQLVVGPYARYAQKLLGSRAPLVDRTDYSITSAAVRVAEQGGGASIEVSEGVKYPDHNGDGMTFAVVLPNRMSTTELQADEAAREAAEQIFALRRARVELVTGELGDTFGAGLESALREIDRLEQQYLELFYGKRCVTTTVERLLIPVAEEKTSYVVARFSPTEGLVAKDNLSGDIVMLAITPSEMSYPEGLEKGAVSYRYANNAEVVVTLQQEALTSTVLPIYEFGKTVLFK